MLENIINYFLVYILIIFQYIKNNMKDKIVVFLNETLRLHDNQLLDFCRKYKGECEVLLVFSFQPELFESTDPIWLSRNISDIRLKFYLESITVL